MSKFTRRIDSLRRFATRPGREKLCVVEAYFYLALARLAVVCLPFKWVARWCGEQGQEMAHWESPREVTQPLVWAIETASRYGWWNCKCLTQAICGKAMLRRRNLASTLYLGVHRPEEGDLMAHAWLRCGNQILTGEEGLEKFTVVGKFT